MLLKNPDERQQSYDELIEQFQFARDEALARMRVGGKTAQRARVVIDDSSSQKALSWFSIAILIMLLAGLVFGGMLIMKLLKEAGENNKPVPMQPGGR
jgi:hypothetical protein